MNYAYKRPSWEQRSLEVLDQEADEKGQKLTTGAGTGGLEGYSEPA